MAADLEYKGGFLVLTATHLLEYEGQRQVKAFRLPLVTSVTVEQALSFRHPILGSILAIGLVFASLGIGVGFADGGRAVMWTGRASIGALFAIFFGLYFAYSIVTARRIWWLRFRYDGSQRLLALPRVDPAALTTFVEELQASTNQIEAG